MPVRMFYSLTRSKRTWYNPPQRLKLIRPNQTEIKLKIVSVFDMDFSILPHYTKRALPAR